MSCVVCRGSWVGLWVVGCESLVVCHVLCVEGRGFGLWVVGCESLVVCHVLCVMCRVSRVVCRVLCVMCRVQGRTQDFLKGGRIFFICIVASRVRKINFT